MVNQRRNLIVVRDIELEFGTLPVGETGNCSSSATTDTQAVAN